ncbi:ABC transporter domain-containing protein, partial [Haematococcus lacustris]
MEVMVVAGQTRGHAGMSKEEMHTLRGSQRHGRCSAPTKRTASRSASRNLGLSCRAIRVLERAAICEVLVIAGGISVGTKIRSAVIDAQRQQKQLAADAHAGRTNTRKQQKISVNKQFAKRLQKILSICIPSPVSREARLVLLQGALLVSRTLLTEWISRIEGWSGSTLVTL